LYRAALAKGVALTGTLTLKNEDDALKQYAAGKAMLADTTARGFLRDRAQLPKAGFGALPTRDGNLATIARTWGFGLVARDANRRQAAQRFAEWLANADHTAAWNRAAGRVPPRRIALNNWSSDSAYREFANQMLGVAVSRPPAGTGASLEVIVQLAIVDVLQNNLSPAEAADKALAAINR
jgi:ABC-type glycerol-3-phosphate transport system substrate-binding protein